MSRDIRFPIMWYVRPAKPQISLRSLTRAFASRFEYSINVKLLTKQHLKFLSIKRGCTGSSESTLVKMPHKWKSHVAAQIHCFLLLSVS